MPACSWVEAISFAIQKNALFGDGYSFEWDSLTKNIIEVHINFKNLCYCQGTTSRIKYKILELVLMVSKENLIVPIFL